MFPGLTILIATIRQSDPGSSAEDTTPMPLDALGRETAAELLFCTQKIYRFAPKKPFERERGRT
jgi:hypothetical protein